MNVDIALSLPASDAPLHRQVYDAVRTAILSGRLRPGDRLPASRSLADQLALSRTTVTEAYEQLEAEGYVQARHGSGTYVAPDLPPDGLHPDMQRAGQPEARCCIPVSTLAHRILQGDYALLFRPPDPESFEFDFRPHLVDADGFPWDAWHGAVERALTRSRQRLLSYPPSAGHPDLREAIAAHVSRYRAVRCDAEQVVVVSGAQQGINLLAQLVLDRGDRAAVEDPGYPSARLSLQALGLEVTPVPVDHDGIVVEALEAAGPQRLVHVTPSHHYPTGATMSLARRLALLDRAQRDRTLVVEDDYDSEFRYEGRPVESLQGLDDHQLVVYAGSFSKSLLAGLRLGFVILPHALVVPFVTAKALWDGGTAMLEQAALAEFMQCGDLERHIRRMRRIYRRRRDALLLALTRYFGPRATTTGCHGGLSMLVHIHPPVPDLVARAHRAGIGIHSASLAYSVPPPSSSILFGFGGIHEDRIGDGIRALAMAAGIAES